MTISKRHIPLIVLIALILVAAGSLYAVGRTQHQPLIVVVANQTSSPLEGLTLVTAAARKPLPSIPAGEAYGLSPQLGESEDALTLIDSAGREYTLLGYFEGDPGGRVTVDVQQVVADGLEGQVLNRTEYSGNHDSALRSAR